MLAISHTTWLTQLTRYTCFSGFLAVCGPQKLTHSIQPENTLFIIYMKMISRHMRRKKLARGKTGEEMARLPLRLSQERPRQRFYKIRSTIEDGETLATRHHNLQL